MPIYLIPTNEQPGLLHLSESLIQGADSINGVDALLVLCGPFVVHFRKWSASSIRSLINSRLFTLTRANLVPSPYRFWREEIES